MNVKFSNEASAIARNDYILEQSQSAPKIARNVKTERDRARGASHRNALNKGKRASWRNESKGGKNIPFPFETCSGKRHRPASFKAKRKAGNRKRA